MTRLLLALLCLAACAESGPPRPGPDERPRERVVAQDRYVIKTSERGFDATLSALLEALDRRELTVFAVIDHAAAAAAAGASLPPTTLVIFGDAATGTPLMRAVPLMGAELPLRGLVYERGGQTYLAVTGMANLARAYPLDDQAALTDRMARTMRTIADEVATP